MIQPGSKAPEISLSTAGGSRFTLEEALAGGAVLVVFYKVSCPTCQLAMPYVDRLASGGGLRVVGVSQNSGPHAAAFGRRFGVERIEPLIDDESTGFAAANAYGISHVPTSFLIEADGTVGRAWTGFSRADLEAAGERAGVAPFRSEDRVPASKPG
ncbi:MAG: TlpA disulfide reductase family protein [Bryobacteraceae bacterium]